MVSKMIIRRLLILRRLKLFIALNATTHCKLCILSYKTASGFLQHKFRIHRTELAAFQTHEEKDVVFGCNNRNKCAIQFASGHHFTREHKSGGQLFKIKFDNNERYCCFRYM